MQLSDFLFGLILFLLAGFELWMFFILVSPTRSAFYKNKALTWLKSHPLVVWVSKTAFYSLSSFFFILSAAAFTIGGILSINEILNMVHKAVDFLFISGIIKEYTAEQLPNGIMAIFIMLLIIAVTDYLQMAIACIKRIEPTPKITFTCLSIRRVPQLRLSRVTK